MEVKIKVEAGLHGAVVLTVEKANGDVVFHDTFKGADEGEVEAKGEALARQWGFQPA
jgi:hypothetical protein